MRKAWLFQRQGQKARKPRNTGGGLEKRSFPLILGGGGGRRPLYKSSHSELTLARKLYIKGIPRSVASFYLLKIEWGVETQREQSIWMKILFSA